MFGEKDYQQLLVVKKMVADMSMPVDIHSVATVREESGLAMSSRNAYLKAEERLHANDLYSVLQGLVATIQDGCLIESAETEALSQMQSNGFDVDYISVRRRHDLSPATAGDNLLIVLAAVRLGKTRLIDNIQFQRSKENSDGPSGSKTSSLMSRCV